MTKEELKEYLKKISLEPELEQLLFDLIDGAAEVNHVLMDAIASVLNLSADLHEKAAEVFEEEAETYQDLAAEVNLLNEEEIKDRLEAFKQNQEQLLSDLNQKIQEAKLGQDVNTLSEVRSTLQNQEPPAA